MTLHKPIQSKTLKNLGIPLSVFILLGSNIAIAAPPKDPKTNINSLSEQLLQILNPPSSSNIILEDENDPEPNEDEDSSTTSDGSDQEDPEDVVVDDGSEDDSVTQEPRFTCQYVNGQYTVMYNPESQPGQSYPWATPGQMGGGWTPEMRCNEISRRLESYRPDGLVQLGTAVENNYNIVCVVTQAVPGCRIVFTVPPGQDPVLTRDRVFQNLVVADDGQRTQGVVTYTSGGEGQILNQLGQILNGNTGSSSNSGNGIDLRPFLDPSDGGTGKLLENDRAVPNNSQPNTKPNSQQLNPDLFR